MRIIQSSLFALALIALPLTATAERSAPSTGDARPAAAEHAPSVDSLIKKHVAALGGEQLLRATKTATYTVSGEKHGKRFTKTVVQARPNKLRVDITSDDGPMSKGYDGKVAWVKKAGKTEILSAEDTIAMALHAEFDEPLLDYAKRGTKVKLVGKSEVKGAPAYELELAFKNGDVEHHFLDANSFLLVQRSFTGKDKDGKAKAMTVRFGDYKKVNGRMINHAIEWTTDDGKAAHSTVSGVAYDVKVDAKTFAAPKD